MTIHSHPQTENLEKLLTATIMIVDDEPINIEVVQAFLEEEGYKRFIAVDDPSKAIAQMEESRPDLVLLDLVMPKVSGFEILDQIRSHPKYKHLPVIILTASTDMESRLKALGLGATDFLAKPLDQCELGLRVRNTLFAKAYQDQLAYYDPLTKLPNRQLFQEDLSWILSTAKRHNEQAALLNLDIDQFDRINDRIGFNVGDDVLKITAQRIQHVIRQSDLLVRTVDDTDLEMKLFHLDGSTFALLLTRINNADNAADVAERILKKIREPMMAEGREIYMTASIGIAIHPLESEAPVELLRLASSAKDTAKKLGGNTFQFSSKENMEIYEKRLRIETKLRQALEKKEFVLHYQPKVDVASGEICGAEALIRWQTDEGLIPPGDFISLLEETGLIIPIGKWCLNEGCRQLKSWHQNGGKPIGLSVNLSARQFADPDLLSSVQQIVQQSGVDASFITLELTESLLLHDIEEKILLMKKLRQIGLKLSIDDFGTGYSSLSYLRQLPVDELKIDRSFIMDLIDNSDTQAIVSTIVFMAKNLHLATVAEGIEQHPELDLLQKLQCDQYQGFFFSRPLTSEQFEELLISEQIKQIRA